MVLKPHFWQPSRCRSPIVSRPWNFFSAVGRKKCILVGHDWGGALGYSFCGKYPDMVSQYIVCNLPHPLSLEEQWKSSLDQVSCLLVGEAFQRGLPSARNNLKCCNFNLSVPVYACSILTSKARSLFLENLTSTVVMHLLQGNALG